MHDLRAQVVRIVVGDVILSPHVCIRVFNDMVLVSKRVSIYIYMRQ